MGRAMAVFSCSLHENLGISMMEGCLAGAIPIVPDRASYKEMYLDIFKYPSEWTDGEENYHKYKHALINFIEDLLLRYDIIKRNELKDQVEILKKDYLNANIMIYNLIRKNAI